MAEHELNKIVDDAGEVFNLRDSTKLSYFDATYVRNNASGDGWVKLADIDSETRSSVDKNAAWDVVLVTANTGIWRESITLDVRFNAPGSGMPQVILFNRKAEVSTRTAFNFCVKVVGLAGSGNTTVELWAYAAKGWYSIGIREAGAGNITKKKNWNYYSYSSDGGSSKPVADAGNNVQVVDPAYVDIDYRTIMQDVSKGANLVVNGSGTMCSNYNWPDFTWVGDYATDASAGAFRRSFNGNDNVFRSCTEYIAINPSRKIDVSVDFNVLSAAVSCTMRMAIGFYDIDKNGISALDVMYGAGTCTTLARDLNPGDTVVYLTSVANWTNDIGQDYKRGFIFWDYANSYGYVYPPETYSRNHYTNWFDSADSVNPTNNTITLNKAWTGLAKVAGTKVSKCDSGATYNYLDNKIVATTEVGTWFNLHAIIKGMSTTGTNPNDKIRQGAAFVKVGFLNTSSNANYTYVFTNYRVYEIPDSAEKIRTARKLAVSLSNTSTDTSFDGSADVTNIKTTGTLGIEYGGTGATSKKAAEYAINGGMAQGSGEPQDSYQFVFSRVGSDQSAKNGVFLYRTAGTIWSWIKGRISSVLGLSESNGVKTFTGNAATATDLAANSVLSVGKGGTGKSSVTPNSYLKGNNTGALVERTYAEVKTDLGLNNVTNDAQVKRTEMGVANGVATLNDKGRVSQSQVNRFELYNNSNSTAYRVIARVISTQTSSGGGWSIVLTLRSAQASWTGVVQGHGDMRASFISTAGNLNSNYPKFYHIEDPNNSGYELVIAYLGGYYRLQATSFQGSSYVDFSVFDTDEPSGTTHGSSNEIKQELVAQSAASSNGVPVAVDDHGELTAVDLSGMTVGTATSANNGVAYINIGTSSATDVQAAFSTGKKLVGRYAMTASQIIDVPLYMVTYTTQTLTTVQSWTFGYSDMKTSGGEGTIYTITLTKSTNTWSSWASSKTVAKTSEDCSMTVGTALQDGWKSVFCGINANGANLYVGEFTNGLPYQTVIRSDSITTSGSITAGGTTTSYGFATNGGVFTGDLSGTANNALQINGYTVEVLASSPVANRISFI